MRCVVADSDVEALRNNESLHRRLIGVVQIAKELDAEDGKQLAERAWLIASVDEVVDERDKLLALLAAERAARERAEEALRRIQHFPVDVMTTAADDLLDVKEIARAALAASEAGSEENT
jgi:hypothetical protein